MFCVYTCAFSTTHVYTSHIHSSKSTPLLDYALTVVLKQSLLAHFFIHTQSAVLSLLIYNKALSNTPILCYEQFPSKMCLRNVFGTRSAPPCFHEFLTVVMAQLLKKVLNLKSNLFWYELNSIFQFVPKDWGQLKKIFVLWLYSTNRIRATPLARADSNAPKISYQSLVGKKLWPKNLIRFLGETSLVLCFPVCFSA